MAGPGGASGPLLLSASGRSVAAGHVSSAAAAVLRVYVSHAALDTLPVCERAAADIAFIVFVWVKQGVTKRCRLSCITKFRPSI